MASSVALAAINNGDKVYLSNGAGTYGHIQGGGEFLVTQATGGSDSFKTFCLEFSEHIAVGSSNKYFATIDDDAQLGGNGGGPNDPLDVKSQFFYAAYRSGKLDDLSSAAPSGSYGAFSYNDNTWASALQLVFWKLENETPSGAISVADAARRDYLISLYNSSTNVFTDVVASVTYYYYVGDVKVMNLWDNYNTVTDARSGPHQSQLYIDATTIPRTEGVPEPATLAIWSLGLGIAGLVKLRRRQMAA